MMFSTSAEVTVSLTKISCAVVPNSTPEIMAWRYLMGTGGRGGLGSNALGNGRRTSGRNGNEALDIGSKNGMGAAGTGGAGAIGANGLGDSGATGVTRAAGMPNPLSSRSLWPRDLDREYADREKAPPAIPLEINFMYASGLGTRSVRSYSVPHAPNVLPTKALYNCC